METLFRTPSESTSHHTHRPKPQHKLVRASMRRDEMDTLQPACDEIFNWLFDSQHQRNPFGSQPSMERLDGQKSLWDHSQETLSSNVTEVLDLLHGSSYVWKAAQILFPSHSTQENIPFVKKQVGCLLNGHVDTVIQELDEMAIHQGLKEKQYKEIEKVCNYFENNAHRMHYDEYLAAGYPIASGVIEGACRHVICDRMERTGMRWVMDGAQSMLGLRCIFINDDGDNFMKFHIEQEQQTLYPVHAANEEEYYKAKVA